jgi:hypothetical protein
LKQAICPNEKNQSFPLGAREPAFGSLPGVAAFFSLGQEEDPPFVFRGMVVRAYWPGATAMQMGQQVADPIEKVIQEIPYAYKIRSYSKPGETVIFLQVDDTAPPQQVSDIWYTTRKRIGDMASTLPSGGSVFQRRVWRYFRRVACIFCRRIQIRRIEGLRASSASGNVESA